MFYKDQLRYMFVTPLALPATLDLLPYPASQILSGLPRFSWVLEGSEPAAIKAALKVLTAPKF